MELPPSDSAQIPRDLRAGGSMTSAELVALIGGGHEVGAAHAKCSGYVGAWTSDPLTWTNEFFPDLMQDDWTWYEACSYTRAAAPRTASKDPSRSRRRPTRRPSTPPSKRSGPLCPSTRPRSLPFPFPSLPLPASSKLYAASC